MDSVHSVRRPTVGALLFPAGLVLSALLTWSHPAAFSYAALVTGFADPAANIVGRHIREPSWPVPGGRKSVAGSAAFFLVALAVGTVFTGAYRTAAAVTALLLTVIEANLGYGLDNLPIPVIAGLLGRFVLNL